MDAFRFQSVSASGERELCMVKYRRWQLIAISRYQLNRRISIMIKIYGMPTCPYCDYVYEQIKGREGEFTYINIGENIRNLSAFMHLRDNSPVFDRCKEIGDVGIPAFVFEDGRVSIDPADAGLIEYGTPNACSVEDHKSGRKGC